MKYMPSEGERVDYEFLEAKTQFVLATPIFKLDADNDKITEELRDSNVRMSRNPADSFFEDFAIDFDSCPETKKLCDTIDDIIISEFVREGNYICPDQKWSHIQQPLESTNPHHHRPSIVSFVYYAKVPEGAGDLVFTIDNYVSITHKPIEGQLVVFPGWVYHKVNKNMADDIRVSISGNYMRLGKGKR